MKNQDITKRQRDISVGSYDYEGLAHWFFYNHGNNQTAGGRLSANYNDIYSYSTVIGRLSQNKEGDVLFLLTSRSYSVTTSKQVQIIRQACPFDIIEVDQPRAITKRDHKKNLQSMLDVAIDWAVKYSRARMDHTRDEYGDNYLNQLGDLMTYAEFFKMRYSSEYKKAVKMHNGDVCITEAAGERAKEIIRREKEQAKARKKREQQARREQELKRPIIEAAALAWVCNQETFTACSPLYLEGENCAFRTAAWTRDMTNLFGHHIIRMSKDGEHVETNGGLKVSAKAARVALKAWNRGKMRRGWNVDGFTVLKFNDEIITIGCHLINKSQAEEVLQ